ncbi:hypothetical protein PE067_09535 [Paracoccus sp. DMF-8]|uniref:hypothetical protein n=1 Tax=Paracoccus sp. DMF-8 TaxID=3019445 RepID=UPI0023E75AF8|nr:hypothetical protein [Paracoccus sp. DMF-8]MDF3606361.1 hypothetical protein [Paracoccus sp. DMF-8]
MTADTTTAPELHRFTKKPVTIEAFQMTKERRMDNSDWPAWLNEAWQNGTLHRLDMDAELPDRLVTKTLEGQHIVAWDDWIIRGVKGELYPCKPDIFAATYERADLCRAPEAQDADPVATTPAPQPSDEAATLCAQLAEAKTALKSLGHHADLLCDSIVEATDPDFIWGALDNVHDAETTLDEYASAVSRAIRAAVEARRASQ